MSKLLRAGVLLILAIAGAVAFAHVATARGETINAAWLLTAAVCTYVVAYRFYSKMIASKIFALDKNRPTPAVRLEDGRDYVPTNRWIVFGHHFAAIAGPGPWSVRPSRHSSAISLASSGSWSAWRSVVRYRTS